MRILGRRRRFAFLSTSDASPSVAAVASAHGRRFILRNDLDAGDALAQFHCFFLCLFYQLSFFFYFSFAHWVFPTLLGFGGFL